MKKDSPDTSESYTCNDYREEMILLGLRNRLLQDANLSREEKDHLEQEISQLEKNMGL